MNYYEKYRSIVNNASNASNMCLKKPFSILKGEIDNITKTFDKFETDWDDSVYLAFKEISVAGVNLESSK